MVCRCQSLDRVCKASRAHASKSKRRRNDSVLGRGRVLIAGRADDAHDSAARNTRRTERSLARMIDLETRLFGSERSHDLVREIVSAVFARSIAAGVFEESRSAGYDDRPAVGAFCASTSVSELFDFKP
jgi:hypothetical protein